MNSEYPISEADESMALRLIGWVVADSVRADRMLALTGLDPASLRAGLSDSALLGALMDFVISHEPDLIACARDLAVEPAALVAARARIGR
ncbi:DUF3572 family protein [Sphingobium lignivorans]|uniref:DUF3572 family protein n=1 Tax=Sphingobium lignivorans TaxID=2735886 RepID=A0ABR6NKL6_9SPHN|nr:DUF3572 family protein [Sphingobium lignivorans]MBB5987828.1 hypothetical protein [Sphingobium lignivorans]